VRSTIPVFKTRSDLVKRVYLDGMNDVIIDTKIPYIEVELPWSGELEYKFARLGSSGEDIVTHLSSQPQGGIEELIFVAAPHDSTFVDICKSTSVSWKKAFELFGEALKGAGAPDDLKFVPAGSLQTAMAGDR
jgi:hypothetical protein